MRKLNLILILITLLTAAFSASADVKQTKKQLFEKYEKQLHATTSARDSVRILYYLFDLSDRKGQMNLAWDIYYTAGRADNVTAQLDMLRNLAAFYANDDTIINHLLELTDAIPNEISRSATRTFILNQQISRKSRKPDDTELQRMLLDSITHSHNLNGNDIYDRISLLYQVIQYLGVDSDGVLFKECLDRYAELMQELPNSDYPLKNQYYTTAAIIHSRLNGNPEKAIQYDKNLLDIIEQLQQMYIKKKRTFRNYDINKYISYRRMMSNYRGLTEAEIEEVYDSIQVLYDRDPDVLRSIETDGDARGFYYMAKKDYTKALPLMKHILKTPNLSAYNGQKYTSMLMEAAKAVGDQQAYISAMERFIRYSNQIDSLRRISMSREIMLRDSILTTPLLYKEPASDKSKRQSANNKMETSLAIVACALAILLVVYIILYVKLRLKK